MKDCDGECQGAHMYAVQRPGSKVYFESVKVCSRGEYA